MSSLYPLHASFVEITRDVSTINVMQVCTSSNNVLIIIIYIYMAALLVWGVYLTVQVRVAHHQFNYKWRALW